MRRASPVRRAVRSLAIAALATAAGCAPFRLVPPAPTNVYARTESDGTVSRGGAKAPCDAPAHASVDFRKAAGVNRVQSIDTGKGIVSGLGGRHVQIAIFDTGIDGGHQDFGTRIILKENEIGTHGTLVAGVVAGSGARSNGLDSWNCRNGGTPFQWAGMAPLAELVDVRRKASTTIKWGRLVREVGVDLSNHSYSLSADGDYDEDNARSDSLVRGDAETGGQRVPPRLQVHSAGNEGSKADFGVQTGFFSLTRQVKNGLVVGNFNIDRAAISSSSSLGPTYDGRIKPDLVAAGTSVKSTGFCGQGFKVACAGSTPPGQVKRQNWYHKDKGTSFSAAVVTGGLALVLEAYAQSFGVELDRSPPLPSTLRTVAIHTARDVVGGPWEENGEGPVLAFPGPDFVTGWGLLDVEQAVRVVQRRELLEDSLRATCDSLEFVFTIPTDTVLKVTLGWDDPAAPLHRPFSASLLVNDLDLVLVAPDGTRHRPWLLDQAAVNAQGQPVGDDQQRCGMPLVIRRRALPGPPEANGIDSVQNAFEPAVRGRDHLNNVEQVVVAAAVPGQWRARVIGYNIAQGPQRFSLVGIIR